EQAGADHHRQRPRRVAELRSQRPHDPARHRDRRPRPAVGGLGRRPLQATTFGGPRGRRAPAGPGALHRMTDAMHKGDAMRAYYSPILVTFAIAALIAGCSTTPEGGDQSGAPVTDATKPGAKPGAGAQTGPIAKIDVTKPGATAGADPK